MNNTENALTLIVPSGPKQTPSVRNRAGEQVPTRGVIQRWFGVEQKIDIDTAQAGLRRSLRQVRSMLQDVEQEAIEGWDLDGLSVSLAISTEGSIGIATAGVQASIEVNFARDMRARPGRVEADGS